MEVKLKWQDQSLIIQIINILYTKLNSNEKKVKIKSQAPQRYNDQQI